MRVAGLLVVALWMATLLGKMLRIDVGYRVPPDNPFLDGAPVAALGEIWAFGLRNPWRFGFDAPERGGTGAMVIADVGQGSWEEIDYEPAGAGERNYGWRIREGAHFHVTSLPPAYLPLTEPIAEYDHTVGRSITGGDVYRGGALPTPYVGRYFFGDYIEGRDWSLGLDVDAVTGEASAGSEVEHTSELGGAAVLGNISAMGTDSNGELYVLNYSQGTILKILPTLTPGDLFVDFGMPWGLWVLIDGVGWQQIHWYSPESILTGPRRSRESTHLCSDKVTHTTSESSSRWIVVIPRQRRGFGRSRPASKEAYSG